MHDLGLNEKNVQTASAWIPPHSITSDATLEPLSDERDARAIDAAAATAAPPPAGSG